MEAKTGNDSVRKGSGFDRIATGWDDWSLGLRLVYAYWPSRVFNRGRFLVPEEDTNACQGYEGDQNKRREVGLFHSERFLPGHGANRDWCVYGALLLWLYEILQLLSIVTSGGGHVRKA
jgi:hypothetical protein